MNCVCTWDEKGNVLQMCGAHAERARKYAEGVCGKPQHGDYDEVVAQRDYQLRRANMFEKMLLDGIVIR